MLGVRQNSRYHPSQVADSKLNPRDARQIEIHLDLIAWNSAGPCDWQRFHLHLPRGGEP
jgi:hypothetical protein